MRALFIDDDALNRSVMSAMLATADVQMDEAQDGPEGLTKVEADVYDFVLVDLRMPGMDGLEVVTRIRARSDAMAKVPLVVVTADQGADLEEQCRKAGADSMISKPVAMDLLFQVLGRILASRAAP